MFPKYAKKEALPSRASKTPSLKEASAGARSDNNYGTARQCQNVTMYPIPFIMGEGTPI